MISRDLEPQIEQQAEPVSACRTTCSNWFDPNFFKSVINVKDIFCPMNWRKPLWWGATAAALGGVIAVEVTTGAFSTAAAYNNVGIMAALYAVDPVVQTINIFAAKYSPSLSKQAELASATLDPVEESMHEVTHELELEPAQEPDDIESQRHPARHSPYASESEIDQHSDSHDSSKGKDELDSPYASDNETVYDYIVDEHESPAGKTSLELEIEENHCKNKDVAVVIPCHLAADKIEATIRSLLVHVEPHQIFIIDNGNGKEPMDNTREVVARISPKINYVWGHKGNKTYAQLIGTYLAKDFKYIYTSDDDMRVPRYFSFGAERINDTTKAVCYPILGVHPEPGQTNWWIRAQSLEYTLADCSKLAQDRFGDVLYPHGAASLWEKETFLRVLHKHTAIFYAEDVQFGMLLQQIGYAMTMESGACLDTEAPTSLFGPNPNFVQQRGRSWEMGRQFNYFKFVYQLFCVTPPTKSPVNVVMHKLAEAYAVYTNTVDWMRLPLFLIMLRNPDYWIRLAIVVGAGYVPILGWNYIKLPLNDRKDLQAGFFDILTYPVFKLIESAMSIYGIGRLLSVYGPNYVHKPTVKEFEESFLSDRAGLEKEIHAEALNPKIPPVTYKTTMYDRFFKAAQGNDEIERAFDESMYHIYQDAVLEAMEQGFSTAYTTGLQVAAELGAQSPRINPMYDDNPLQGDNPLFDNDSLPQHSRFFKPAASVDPIEREFNENSHYIYPDKMFDEMEQGRFHPFVCHVQAATELGALNTVQNPVYHHNPLEQDNPLYDPDSLSIPQKQAMKL